MFKIEEVKEYFAVVSKGHVLRVFDNFEDTLIQARHYYQQPRYNFEIDIAKCNEHGKIIKYLL